MWISWKFINIWVHAFQYGFALFDEYEVRNVCHGMTRVWKRAMTISPGKPIISKGYIPWNNNKHVFLYSTDQTHRIHIQKEHKAVN